MFEFRVRRGGVFLSGIDLGVLAPGNPRVRQTLWSIRVKHLLTGTAW